MLRNNQLDDEAIYSISNGLGDLKRHNTKLLHLNLSSNRIGDKGATFLAKVIKSFEKFYHYFMCKFFLVLKNKSYNINTKSS